MAVSFSGIWNMFLYNAEEDPLEAFVVVPEDAPLVPENEQPVGDLSTLNSPASEASNTEISITGNGATGNLDFNAKTAASNLPDNRQIEAEDEQSEIVSVAADTSTLPTEQATANSPVAEASDTELSNTEKGRVGDLDSIAETLSSDLQDDSQIEADNEQLKLVSKATNALCLTGHATDDSSDSNGEIHQSSPACPLFSAEEKLQNKLFLFQTTATIIGLVVPILTIGVGAGNIGNCPADSCIPYLVLIIGIQSLCTVLYPLLRSTRENFDCWTQYEEDVTSVACLILGVLWMCKDKLFFSMNASFDMSAENYCNPAFYAFNIFLDMFLANLCVVGTSLFILHCKIRPTSPASDEDWMMFE